jgi:hypothetical protein
LSNEQGTRLWAKKEKEFLGEINFKAYFGPTFQIIAKKLLLSSCVGQNEEENIHIETGAVVETSHIQISACAINPNYTEWRIRILDPNPGSESRSRVKKTTSQKNCSI